MMLIEWLEKTRRKEMKDKGYVLCMNCPKGKNIGDGFIKCGIKPFHVIFKWKYIKCLSYPENKEE